MAYQGFTWWIILLENNTHENADVTAASVFDKRDWPQNAFYLRMLVNRCIFLWNRTSWSREALIIIQELYFEFIQFYFSNGVSRFWS